MMLLTLTALFAIAVATAAAGLGDDIEAVPLLDGQVVRVAFYEDQEFLLFSYQAIDANATFSFTVFPGEDDNANKQQFLTVIHPSKNFSTRTLGGGVGYINVELPTVDTESNTYNMVQSPIYILMEGRPGATAHIYAMSSVILKNERTITINPKKDKDYDYAGNNYTRYFRLFACDQDQTTTKKGSITVAGLPVQHEGVNVYFNFQDTVGNQEQGRPSKDNCDYSSKGHIIKLTSLSSFHAPGWIFISVSLDTTALADLTDNDDYDITIQADLEFPEDYITPTAPYETNLCFYEDCYEFTHFNPEVYIGTSEEEIEVKSLHFVAMIADSVIHDHQGHIATEAMTSSYFEDINDFHKEGTSILELDQVDRDILLYHKIDDLLIAVTTTNLHSYLLPLYGIDEPESAHFKVITTLVKDAEVYKLGGKQLTVATYLQDYWSDSGIDPVYGRRLILDTTLENRVYYLQDTYSNGIAKHPIKCNYFIDVRPADNKTDLTDILAAVYIGNGYASMPYYMYDEENEEVSGFDYAFVSKNFYANDTEGIPVDTQIIRIDSNSNEYYQDGTYLLDVWDTHYDKASAADTGINLAVYGHPSFVIDGNHEYVKELNSQSTYDYFTFKSKDIAKGITIQVELVEPASTSEPVNIYASFINPLPTSSSRYVAQGNVSALLHIKESSFEEYEDTTTTGQYTVYIAIDTLHTGKMKLIVTEGISSMSHVYNGEAIETSIPIGGDLSIAMFHSSENSQQKSLVITIEDADSTWPDNVILDACVYESLFTTYQECFEVSGHFGSLSSAGGKLMIDNILLPETYDLHPDYFIHLQAKATGGSTTAQYLKLKILGEDYDDLASSDPVESMVNEALVPIVYKIHTLWRDEEGYRDDYTLVLNIESGAKTATMNVKICKDYPSIDFENPPNVGDDNIRNCVSDTLVNGKQLTIDLVGDTLINEGTIVNDTLFIRSDVKYVTIYPINSAYRATLTAELYQDAHVNANMNEKPLVGNYYSESYFRLLILSQDSVSKQDFLSYRFYGNYPIQFCVSTTPHEPIGSSNCKDGSVDYDTNQTSYTINSGIKLTDLDESYSARSDVYAYFTFKFPEASEDNPSSVRVKFSNTIVHYLPVISDTKDDIDKDTYYFELATGKRVSFYTNAFEYGTPLRFFIVPDVKDWKTITNVSNTDSYSTTRIGITNSTSYLDSFPIADATNANLMAAGIVSYDYTITNSTGPNNTKYFSIGAEFLDSTIAKPAGLYKAGFVNISPNVGSAISQMVQIEAGERYKFSYDKTNPNQASDLSKSRMYYYPKATSDMVMYVYPCAGIPGINTSFVNPEPTANDKHYSMQFPQTGYTRGAEFTVHFYNTLDNEMDTTITIPTGFMFNATFWNNYYVPEVNPDETTRWDAELVLISGSGRYGSGGPKAKPKDLLVTTRGAEVTVEFTQALSGFSTDPSITKTRIEYALYAMPAPNEGQENLNFDASPRTHCGLFNYGIPITVDDDDKVAWTKGTIDTNADGSNTDPDSLTTRMTLVSNYDPRDYAYPSGMIINRDGTTNKNTSRFNVNVIAREILIDSANNTEKVIGYTAYTNYLVEISGSMPSSPGGLFGWEIAIIVIVVILVVVIAVFIIYTCIKKKKQAMGYGNLDGHGNTNKHGLNVDLPDDDLSISASSSTSRYEQSRE